MRVGLGLGLGTPGVSPLLRSVTLGTDPGGAGAFTLPSWLVLTCATAGRTSQTSAATFRTGFGANAARARSVDGSVWGLSVESARTQLAIRSDALDNASWAKGSGITITANSAADPAVNTVADKVTQDQALADACSVGITPDQSAGLFVVSGWLQKSATNPITAKIAMYDGAAVTAFNVTTSLVAGAWRRVDGAHSQGAGTHRAYVQFDSAPTQDGDELATAWQYEAGAYPSSYVPTTAAAIARAADVLSIPDPTLVTQSGFFDMTMVVAPNYATAEQAGDHDLFFLDSDNRVYIQQSTAKLVLRVGGANVLSSALTWSRNQALTVRAVHSASAGRILSVSGATTGDGTATGSAASAISLPSAAYLLGNASGAQECADLRSVQFVRP